MIDRGAANYGEVEPVSLRRAVNYKDYLENLMRNDWYRYAYHLPVLPIPAKNPPFVSPVLTRGVWPVLEFNAFKRLLKQTGGKDNSRFGDGLPAENSCEQAAGLCRGAFLKFRLKFGRHPETQQHEQTQCS